MTSVAENLVSRPVPLLSSGESILTTKTGRQITTRQLDCGDTPLLVDLFNRLSERTRWLRFSKPRSVDVVVWREAARLSNARSQAHTTLVGVVRENDEDRLVALVQIVPVGADVAEVAAVVRDDYQNDGVGKAICRLAAEVAMSRGVRTLQILTLAENKVVQWLVRNMGMPYTSDVRCGEVAIRVQLTSDR
jgi:GNAT superfamily N-acetyltransferase